MRTIDIWYVCDEILCNFDCNYCSTQQPRREGGRKVWASPDGEARYRAIVGWLAALPWRLNIRLQTLGEPFMSRAFLDGAARLSHAPNVNFVELVTNGSFTARRLADFAGRAAMDKISLWITYHHGQIAAETLIANALRAQAAGAFVVVHALLFPGTSAAVEDLAERCRRASLRIDFTIGHNLNDAFPGEGLLPALKSDASFVLDSYRLAPALEAMLLAHKGPGGLPCSAGHDYLRIFSDGEVYPCSPYRGAEERRLGNALEPGFVPALRAQPNAPCAARRICACKEDYFHLDAARSRLRFERSLGYYEPDARRVGPRIGAAAAGGAA